MEIAAPVIAGVNITMDDDGRYNLNDLHAAAVASGDATASQRPSVFLRSAQIKRFIETLQAKATKLALEQNQSVTNGMTKALKSALEQNQPLKVIKGGNAPGVWAVELLAIRYAAWIKPEFEIEVYETFLNYRTGKLTQPAGINEQLLQELLFQMRENQEYQRREITTLRSELAQLQTERNLPMSATIDQQLLRERDELAERLGRSRNYATLDAVERKMGREYQWHRLRNWCLRNNVEPLVLRKFQCVHAWPRGAWLDVYGVNLEELFG
ncbi:KilA-N domain-containing protein [Citrobacter freundii]|uniref:KilA-N domain-containing protein n=1 Tax=Citrobacter freundii TaxID=546 RepID=UPI003A84AA54